jgi:hypothetical protein
MSRVLALVEGQTEETFVRDMLAPHLALQGIWLTGYLAKRRGTGGVPRWSAFKPDLLKLLREDTTAYVTMMIDFYAMPDDWPGRVEAKIMTYPANVQHVEAEVSKDVAAKMGSGFSPARLLPYAQCHEYEALLFSDPPKVEAYVAQPGVAGKLAAVLTECGSPEEVNDNQLTAPSKRIVKIIEGYRKELYGTLLALEIGLPKLRLECPHFNEWVTKLEDLAPS